MGSRLASWCASKPEMLGWSVPAENRMFGRSTALTPPALLCSLLLALSRTTSEAKAHRLDAVAKRLPDGRVRVESWFSDDTRPWHATVQVFGADGEKLVEDELNEEGIFVFSPGKQEASRMVIMTLDGHRKEVPVTNAPLSGTTSQEPVPLAHDGGKPPISRDPVPLAQHDTGPPIRDLLVGIAILLALAAFVLACAMHND